MKRARHTGVALVVTLTLVALLAVVVVAYLGSTRADRVESSVFANRLRAKTMADSGLAAATKLLYNNTKYGNYVTAMPAPPAANTSPTPIRTEIYRPTDPTFPGAPDYLRVNNAIGEVLTSQADTTAAVPAAPVDPRPAATPIPVPAAGGEWGLPDPAFDADDSFNFNQIVRMGSNAAARLVHPKGQPAYGEWVRVRDAANQLTGRYAFFIEDESMKVNVDTTGNASGSPHLRLNDLAAVPASTPASQIEEVDPTALLPSTARVAANAALTASGAPGARLPTKGTTALLNEWSANTPDQYAHLITVLSKDDQTTARGWQRLDLNAIVAAAEVSGGNASKAAGAQKIADWMRDAWTGPTAIANLKQDSDGWHYQVFSDARLRLQIAANIVDYIDADNIPTDLGDLKPTGFAGELPVIGIEKIPYLGHIFIIYEASGSNGTSATLRVKVRFTFFNLYESELDLRQSVTRIRLVGIPAVFKNDTAVFSETTKEYSIPLSELTPLHTDGFVIKPADLSGSTIVTEAGSGARTFESGWIVPGQLVTFTGAQNQRPQFRSLDAPLEVTVFGRGLGGAEVRLDATASQTSDGQSGYQRGSNGSIGNFLGTSATPRSTAAIYEQKRKLISGTTQDLGDPRFRPPLLNDRWRRLTTLTDPEAVSDRLNKMDTDASTYPNPRVYAIDWFDNYSNRPLAFLRNGPMLNIGELGNVSFAEYPWRTGYLQHPERPAMANDSTTFNDITTRRREALDYVLVDLFRAGGNQRRSGALNINTQQQHLPPGSTTSTHSFLPLFLGLPLGTATPQTLTDTGGAPSATRLSTGVNVIVSTTTTPPTSPAFTGSNLKDYRVSSVSNRRLKLAGEEPTPDNDPLRPFFQTGELAPFLSRLISASASSQVSSSDSSTSVIYSVLRNTPTAVNQANANYKRDTLIEQPFREVSNAVTTRGDVFRVLYVGQAIRDQKSGTGTLGEVENASEITAEYLAEAYVERQAVFEPDPANPNAMRTSDSKYRVISSRVITE